MSALVEAVAHKLGGLPVLGSTVRSQADLALAVRRRVPLSALNGLSQAGFSDQEIERWVIPQRTRRHRAEKNQPLTVEESDRAVRLLRIQTMAEDTFRQVDKANVWPRWMERRPWAWRKRKPALASSRPFWRRLPGARPPDAVMGTVRQPPGVSV